MFSLPLKDLISDFYKNPRNLDIQKKPWNYPKFWTMWFYYRVMQPTDADWMANSVDPDQTAPSVCLKTQDHYSTKDLPL